MLCCAVLFCDEVLANQPPAPPTDGTGSVRLKMSTMTSTSWKDGNWLLVHKYPRPRNSCQIIVFTSFVTIYYNESGHQVHEYKSLDDLLTTSFACFSPALQSAMKMGEERPWKADGLPHEFPPVVYFKVR